MEEQVGSRLIQSYCNIHREAEVHKFLNRFPALKEKQHYLKLNLSPDATLVNNYSQ